MKNWKKFLAVFSKSIRGTLAKLIGKRHGIYALYHENDLYYVGRASRP